MKRTAFQILAWTILTVATANARQTVAPAQQRPRISAQQPQGAAGKVPKQSQQLPRNLTADKPNAPKRNEQQKKMTANAVVDRYVSGFQKNVGLSDEQTRNFSPVLGRYVRRQLDLAQTRNEQRRQLKEMTDRQAPEDEIQSQIDQVKRTERQLANTERTFYDNINSQLSAQQKAKLQLYLEETGENIRQAIQKSRDN